jgi:drug/metabolite transporter (DMT)-like permease
MSNPKPQPAGNAWLTFALLTVFSWGVYGVFLSMGGKGMADPANGLLKAFLFVGLAYFFVAVLAPLLLLLVRGANWNYPPDGMGWSLVAGAAGALGALGVLLAFQAHGQPGVVMAIVFAGAPIVNAFISLLQHPPAGGWAGIKPQFWGGIAIAALGGCLVTAFKPHPPAHGLHVADPGLTWLYYSLLTVSAWGVYGVLLHTGQVKMRDAADGRYKAFLFVGLAYLLVAVAVPFLLLVLSGANWKYPLGGMSWSLVAGIFGAIGAFCVLLAFGAKGIPSVVMAIVFAGAPVVNAIVALIQRPPSGGWSSISGLFWIGILCAALGGCLVTLFKPLPSAGPKPEPAIAGSTVAAH